MKHYDIVVIGFGKAGKTLALKAGSLGKKVALVEKSSDMYGGTCINVGCIPTKRLVALSKDAKFKNDKQEYYKSSVELKDKLISALRAKNYAMLNDNENINVINQTAIFIDKNTINLKESGESISGDVVVINTGSVSVKPDFKVESNLVYQSDEILNLKELPNELVVVGGGFIGLELASYFANFGSKVTILTRSKILKNEDDDLKDSVLASLKNQNINIIEDADIKSIKDDEIFYNDTSIRANAFLLALSRVANTNELGLKNAKISVKQNGGIQTNEFLQTSWENIYAVGDVRGDEFFTYISLDDFRIVFSHIFGDKSRNINNRSPYAKVVFTNTPFAKIGLSERLAKDRGIDVKVLKVALANVPNAKILGNDEGFLKAIVSASSGEILGATFHCVDAHEIINEIAIAMKFKATANDLKNQIFTHPSISEALNDLFSQF